MIPIPQNKCVCHFVFHVLLEQARFFSMSSWFQIQDYCSGCDRLNI